MKNDVFGQVYLTLDDNRQLILRNTGQASAWAAMFARRLLAREALALQALAGLAGVPELVSRDRDTLRRSYIDGGPMHEQKPADPAYYGEALRLVRRMHCLGVAHNDLAKEPNWLVTTTGGPAVIDFQLALVRPARGWLFRQLAREDLRHMLKHKRTYCPDKLTAREKSILERPALISRMWKASGKRLYLFVSRRLLGWQDREGTFERNDAP